jgi:SHS2 domain-containing protein
MFAAAAEALVSIAIKTADVEPRAQYKIGASGEDEESLLVNFLNEVLYQLDGARIAFRRFEVSQIEGDRVEATGWGESRDAERHRARIVVKGVTYHQLRITHTPERSEAEVYVDI